MNLEPFIDVWKRSAAAERANYQSFLKELCVLLEVPQPEPTRATADDNAYVFERDVTFHEADGTHSIGRIDLYKRGCFVLEAKQRSDAQAAADAAEQALTAANNRPKQKRGTAIRGTVAWDDAPDQSQRPGRSLRPRHR